MNKALNDDFIGYLIDLIEYAEWKGIKEEFLKEKKHRKIDAHPYQSIVYLKAVVGGPLDISYKEAMKLLKTDLRDNVMTSMGEGMGWEEASEDEVSSNLYQLWII